MIEHPAKFLSKKEAAAWLNVCTRTIDRMIAAGELKRIKVRGCVRIAVKDLERITGGLVS